VLATVSLQAQVTFDRLLRADREPNNWLTYSGNVWGQRYSPLTQITTANVKNLELQWVWQAKSLEKFKTTALVVDGVLYTIQAPNNTNTADANTQVVALDAATGRQFRTFRYDIPSTARACCARVTRGLALLGDNLYSDCVLALDADTGKLKWYYQFTPHDEMDYDSTQVPVLADIEFKGKMRKVMLWANRNGVMYVLDRITGEFLQGKPFVKVNWMDGFDKDGRPHRVPGKLPGADGDGTPIMPTVLGGTN